MFRLTLFLLLTGLFTSCSDRSAEMAEDICHCFDPITRAMSSETKAIFRKANDSRDPTGTINQELARLGEPQRKKVVGELSGLAALDDPAHPLSRCARDLKEKYAAENADPAIDRKVFNAMKKRPGCEVGAYFAGRSVAKSQ